MSPSLNSRIEATGLTVSRGPCVVLRGLDFDFHAGEMVAVIGLNGAGKSTLLETVAGLLTGYSGQCRLQDREISAWPRVELSRQLAFLPQSAGQHSSVIARQVVFMGRYPHSQGWRESPEDALAVDRALADASCAELAQRPFNSLSGGERQRVLLAAVFAQQAPILLLDEPATHIDLPHQIDTYRLLRQRAEAGLLCIAATHDLNLAAVFASRVLLLHEGGVAAMGSPAEVFEGAAFRRAFGPSVGVERQISGNVLVTYQSGQQSGGLSS